MRCVITGAGGFVGRALLPFLAGRGWQVEGWSRNDGFDLDAAGSGADWRRRLAGADAVVHLAARVHQLHEDGDAQLQRYLRVNRDGTARLAEAAGAAGVGRFILLSTAKVFGEGGDGPYGEASPPAPRGAYAASKLAAEQALVEAAGCRGMEFVIIRPPLVYGRGVGGNFLRLQRIAALGLPLPLASVANRRDLVALDNLTDLIALALEHPAAAGRALLCSDGRPYALPELIAAMRRAAGRRPGLLPCPPPLLRGAGRLLLGEAAVARLLDNFELDIGETCRMLGWSPRTGLPETLRNMAQHVA